MIYARHLDRTNSSSRKSSLVRVDNDANEDLGVRDYIYTSRVVLRAEHSHLVKFEHLIGLSECAILKNKAIPPVRV